MSFFRLLLCTALLLTLPGLLSAQSPAGAEIQVNVQTFSTQQFPQMASNTRGDFVVAWVSAHADDLNYTLYVRRFAPNGLPMTGEIRVKDRADNGFADARLAMMDDGSFVVAFFRVDHGRPTLQARRYSPSGTPMGPDAILAHGGFTSFELATQGDGGFVAVWEAYPPQIRARAFGPDSRPLGPEVVVDRSGNFPVVAMGPGGEFVVAWMDVAAAEDPEEFTVFAAARRFTSQGFPAGKQFAVSPRASQSFVDVRVGKDGEGNFLIVWGGVFDQLGEGSFARRYKATGEPLGEIVRLGPLGLSESMAMGPLGNFVLAWHGQGLSDSDIFARRFAADGSPLGEAVRVNEYTPDIQDLPKVGVGVGGGSIVVWDSEGQDGSLSGVFARRLRRR